MNGIFLTFVAAAIVVSAAQAAPYAAMMIILSLPLTLLLYAQSKRTAGQ